MPVLAAPAAQNSGGRMWKRWQWQQQQEWQPQQHVTGHSSVRANVELEETCLNSLRTCVTCTGAGPTHLLAVGKRPVPQCVSYAQQVPPPPSNPLLTSQWFTNNAPLGPLAHTSA
jgi:hypothetical protein